MFDRTKTAVRDSETVRHVLANAVVASIGLVVVAAMIARNRGGGPPPVVGPRDPNRDSAKVQMLKPEAKPAKPRAEEPKSEPVPPEEPAPVMPAKPAQPAQEPVPAPEPTPSEPVRPAPAIQPRVLSSVLFDAVGEVIRSQKPQPNAVEKNPQPLDKLGEQEIDSLARDYFAWSEKEQLRILLEIGDLSPAQMERLVAGFLLRANTRWLRAGKDYQFAQYEPDGAKCLTGPLPASKWTKQLDAAACKLFAASAGVEARFVLADAVTVEIFRQLADAIQKNPELAQSEFVFRARATGTAVSVELLTRSRK